jgi:hypothetical protein
MSVDRRLVFVARALSEVVANNETLEADELAGLSRILDDIVIDCRKEGNRHE